MATAIAQQKAKFNFNHEINDARIQKMKIMLPTDDLGKPDFAYREQHAKNMLIKKYQQYLDYQRN